MGVLDNIQDGIGSIENYISQNPLTASGVALASGVAVGAGVTGLVASQIKKSKKKSKKSKKRSSKKKKRITHTRRGLIQDRKRRSKQPWEVAYQRRKKRKNRIKSTNRHSKKRVGKLYYTKKGQPYKILSSGKARFVKK